MPELTTPIQEDASSRTWHVLEREDKSISIYFTLPGESCVHVVYDTLDLLPSPIIEEYEKTINTENTGGLSSCTLDEENIFAVSANTGIPVRILRGELREMQLPISVEEQDILLVALGIAIDDRGIKDDSWEKLYEKIKDLGRVE